MNNRIYFVYRHKRLDTNQIFYIGIGTSVDKNTHKGIYHRAYAKSKRNIVWKRIVAKTNYEVEIIYETYDIEEVQEKEREFIKLYKDTVCNMTEGGLGITSYNHTECTKLQISTSTKGIKKSKEHIVNMNKRKFIPIIVYNDYFYKKYDSITDAIIDLNLPINSAPNISNCLKGKRSQCQKYKFKYFKDVELQDKELVR